MNTVAVLYLRCLQRRRRLVRESFERADDRNGEKIQPSASLIEQSFLYLALLSLWQFALETTWPRMSIAFMRGLARRCRRRNLASLYLL